jgi:hypothetical protein
MLQKINYILIKINKIGYALYRLCFIPKTESYSVQKVTSASESTDYSRGLATICHILSFLLKLSTECRLAGDDITC